MTVGIDKPSGVRLAFVGDICLAGGLQSDLRERGPDFPFARVREVLKPADLVVGNLECCIVDEHLVSEVPSNLMIVPEDLASGLAQSGINIVSLANNHILDGGEMGLASTKRFLERHGIQYFGAGADLAEAERPLFISHNCVTFAFLGACDVPQVFATNSRNGVPPLDIARLRRRITECKTGADVVVVSIHADLEFTPYPSPSRVRLSRRLADDGADLVIQHHPHVCQGIEERNDGIIAYSLGNFVFRVHGNTYLQNNTGTDWGIVLQVDVSTSATRPRFFYTVVPVTINARNQTSPSIGPERDAQLLFVAEISRALGNWNLLRRKRMARCMTEARSTVLALYYLGRRKGVLAMTLAGLKLLLNPYERRWMYSVMSCGLFG